MGFLVPAAAVGVCLLVTKKDKALQSKLFLYQDAGVSFGYKYPYTTMVQSNTGINFFFRKWMSVGIEFTATMPFDPYNNSPGFSLRPFARFYPLNSGKISAWFESGGGFVMFTDEFPKSTPHDGREGTYWNGTTKYGVGLGLKWKPDLEFQFAVRHLHISNGNTKGVERNPSHDSNGLFLGLTWKIK